MTTYFQPTIAQLTSWINDLNSPLASGMFKAFLNPTGTKGNQGGITFNIIGGSDESRFYAASGYQGTGTINLDPKGVQQFINKTHVSVVQIAKA